MRTCNVYMVWWSIVYTMLGRNQTLWWAVKCSNKQGITWRQKVSFWIERLWSGRGKKLGKSTVRERWLSLRHYQGALMLKRWQWPKNLGDVAALNTVFRLRKVDRIRLLKTYVFWTHKHAKQPRYRKRGAVWLHRIHSYKIEARHTFFWGVAKFLLLQQSLHVSGCWALYYFRSRVWGVKQS